MVDLSDVKEIVNPAADYYSRPDMKALVDVFGRLLRHPDTYRTVRKVTGLVSSIADHLPSASDTPFAAGMKLAGLVDVAAEALVEEDEFKRYCRAVGITEVTSNIYLCGVLNAAALEGVVIRSFREFRNANGSNNKTYEYEYRGFRCLGYPTYEGNTYYGALAFQENFPFQDVADELWSLYRNRLRFIKRDSTNLSSRFGELLFQAAKVPPFSVFGKSKDLLREIGEADREYTRCTGRNKSYCFYGPPGTGKSTFAWSLAAQSAKKVICVDGRLLKSPMEVIRAAETMRAEIVMLDDFDKVLQRPEDPIEDLLAMFVEARSLNISMYVTANDIHGFDRGFARPDRIDTWIKFEAPDAQDRKQVLRGYLGEAFDDSQLAQLVIATEGLTQDYLREVALLAKFKPLLEVEIAITTMLRVMKETGRDG